MIVQPLRSTQVQSSFLIMSDSGEVASRISLITAFGAAADLTVRSVRLHWINLMSCSPIAIKSHIDFDAADRTTS